MRVLKPNPWLAGLGALLGLFVSARVASADVTTDQSASILVFPKVIADGTRDTLIQISNTSNSLVFVECIYVDASPEIPGLPPGPNNPRRWVARDFGPLRLTRQQPTIWRVSTGRLLDLSTPPGACEDVPDPNDSSVTRQRCPGFPPFNIPSTTTGTPGTSTFVGFEGELKCVQVDDSGAPVGGNALKGEAVLEGTGGLISEYNAIGIVGVSVNSDLVLNLNVTTPNGAGEYNACPDRLILQHFATNADDPGLLAQGVPDGVVSMQTEITVVPCTEDFLDGTPPVVPLTLFVVDEMESRLSTFITLQCWLNTTLDFDTVFDTVNRSGSVVLKTEIRPSSTAAGTGILGVAEEFRVINGTRMGSSASNMDAEGARAAGDTITLHPDLTTP